MEGRVVVRMMRLWAVVFTGFLVCCAQHGIVPPAPAVQFAARFETPLRGRDAVLVVTPAEEAMRTVLSTFFQEVSEDFDVSVLVTKPETDVATLTTKIQTVKPKCILLMDNSSVVLYRRFQEQYPAHRSPAAIVVMASFLSEILRGLHNTTGIAYEMPGVTIVAKLRMLFDSPINRVGVVHRKQFSQLLARQAALAKPERIEIIGQQVSDQPSVREIQQAIATLRQKRNIDALWILNDNLLLRDRELLAGGWLRSLDGLNLPVLVGVNSLVNPKAHFGTFAMLPDHAALGAQAADIVFELQEQGWDASTRAIESPLSIRTVVDLPLAKRCPGFKLAALGGVDSVLE